MVTILGQFVSISCSNYFATHLFLSSNAPNLSGMKTFSKPWHERIFDAFCQGETVAKAAVIAGVSEPTARKFKKEWGDDIREAQRQSTAGVLDRLKKMLPMAVDRLEFLIKRPQETDQPPAPTPDWWKPKTLEQELKVIRVIFDSFDVMRDVDAERRLAALEKQIKELTADPQAKPPGDKAC